MTASQHRLARVCARAAVIGAVGLSSAARADTGDTDRVLAESLFEQGRELMAKGKYDEACPKLAESQRLDPGGGTLLNLAICHEAQGRTATAWAEFNEALSVAKRDGRSDREKTARDKIAELEGKLAYLTVAVPPEARVAGLDVKVDDVAIRSAAWGAPAPADPGRHVVTASAPGRVPWQGAVSVGGPGDRQSIAIPVLALARSGPADGSSSAPGGDASSGRRTAAFVSGGVGIAAVVVGGIFGVRAIVKKNESDTNCAPSCNADGVDAWNQAKTSAVVADVGIGVGLVGIAVGAYLLATSPHPSATANARSQRLKRQLQTSRVTPIVDRGLTGFALRFGF